MKGHTPRKPSGSDAQFTNAKDAWEKLHGVEGRFNDTPTVKVRKTSRGYFWDATAAGPGGGTSLIQCVITELFNDDYVGVTKYDSTTGLPTGPQFNCAKCFTARMPASEVIDGETITYDHYGSNLLPANSSDNVRLAAFSPVTSEYQVCSPRYLAWPPEAGADVAQFQVIVSKLSNDVGLTDVDGNKILYIEMSPQRRWAWSPQLNGGND